MRREDFQVRQIACLPLLFLLGIASPAFAQSTPIVSPVDQTLQPPVELRNLGTLKNELKQYHDCTGGYGCYTDDLRAQTDRAQAALAARVKARKPDRLRHRRDRAFELA
jgi:hypothetical protein